MPATELPDTAPWTQVAADMNFERYPLDYLRYWKRLKILLANGSVVVDDDNGEEEEEQEQEQEEEQEEEEKSADTPGKRPRSERQKQVAPANDILIKLSETFIVSIILVCEGVNLIQIYIYEFNMPYECVCSAVDTYQQRSFQNECLCISISAPNAYHILLLSLSCAFTLPHAKYVPSAKN